MNPQTFAQVELPPGTTVILHRHAASLSLSWQSARGLHVVRTTIPVAWCQDPTFHADLAGTVDIFRRAIHLEEIGDEAAEEDSPDERPSKS